MLVSGIAKRVLSLMMIWVQCSARPAPPPITTPSHSAIIGLPNSAIARSTRYSPRKKVSASSKPLAMMVSRACRISPPAQKARGALLAITTWLIAGSSRQPSRTCRKSVTIPTVSAFNAFGRSSVTRPAPLITSK